MGIFYQFGPFRLDPAERLLLREESPVPLTPKVFDLLTFLLENRGRLVLKEELLRGLWPDSYVEEANLTVSISALRKALGESRGGSRYIETIPKRGYRFTKEVTEGHLEGAAVPVMAATFSPDVSVPYQATGAEPHLSPAIAPPSESIPIDGADERRGGRRALAWKAVSVAVLCLVALLIAATIWRSRGRVQTAKRSHTIAVLPFQNLNKDPQTEFLGFPLADAIINRLGYVSELTIRPSYAVQRYRGDFPDLQQVAKALNVDTLLTGNFLRDGEKLRVTYQLVDTKDNRILRKGTVTLKYEDLLTVQDEVAEEVLAGLAVTLSPTEVEHLRHEAPIDPLAYEYYLRGVDLYSKNDFGMAISMLEKSVAVFPGYALTWAHLGRTYTAMASFQFGGSEQYRKARTAYQRALDLEPGNLQAQIFMANLLTDTGRAEEAVPLLRRALAVNSNLAEAHWELGYAYRFAGMLEQSARECETARQLDPGVKLTTSAMNAYLYMGDYDRFERSLPALRDSAFMEFYRGFVAYHQHEWQRAKEAFDHAYTIDPEMLQAKIGKALSLRLENRTPKGIALLQTVERTIEQRDVGDAEAIYKLAQAYAALGDDNSAIRTLRESIRKGFFAYPYMVRDPLMDHLRQSPEFAGTIDDARNRHERFQEQFFKANPSAAVREPEAKS